MQTPLDPSPTPWDYTTWGFYCDACKTFFDVVIDGSVDALTMWPFHKCGAKARYIGYDHSRLEQWPNARMFPIDHLPEESH